MEVEAGAYFKKGDVLISTLGNPFIYNGIINREGDMGCIYGISAYGEITSEEVPIWTSVCGEDKSKYVRLATEEEKKSFAERIANTENLKKAGIIKQRITLAESSFEYTVLMDEPDRNLDIDNIMQIYNVLSFHKLQTQIIAIVHNPALIYKLSKLDCVNFIEMTEGYLKDVVNFISETNK